MFCPHITDSFLDRGGGDSLILDVNDLNIGFFISDLDCVCLVLDEEYISRNTWQLTNISVYSIHVTLEVSSPKKVLLKRP